MLRINDNLTIESLQDYIELVEDIYQQIAGDDVLEETRSVNADVAIALRLHLEDLRMINNPIYRPSTGEHYLDREGVLFEVIHLAADRKGREMVVIQNTQTRAVVVYSLTDFLGYVREPKQIRIRRFKKL